MEVINSLDKICFKEESGVSLGTFDGLHRGHNKIMRNLIKNCNRMNYKSVVYTFNNHPREITKNNGPRKIINNRKKIELFKRTGIDYLVIVDFDDFHRNIEAKEFVLDILLKKLNMKTMVVGFDCRFGKNAEGNTDFLKELSIKYKFDLSVIDPFKINNKTVSSTLIRKLIKEGKVTKVNELLGRRYTLEGKVIKGKQMGKKLGFPTANISIDYELCLPKPGIYITETIIDKDKYKSVTNVGYNPTFSQRNYNIETHILDFNSKLYDKVIEIEFHQYIRNEQFFDDLDGLKKQIMNDINSTKKYFKIL